MEWAWLIPVFSFAAAPIIVIKVSDVVHPVEQSDNLVVLLPLAQLLRAAVEIADMRLCTYNLLSVDQPRASLTRHCPGRCLA